MSTIKAVDATLYLSGCDWGPNVSKVIFKISQPINAANKKDSSIATGPTD